MPHDNATQRMLERARQKVALSKKKLALETERERKRQTREKIELGGLIVKAGLKELPRAAILGILMEAKEALNGQDGEGIEHRWLTLGRAEFDKNQD